MPSMYTTIVSVYVVVCYAYYFRLSSHLDCYSFLIADRQQPIYGLSQSPLCSTKCVCVWRTILQLAKILSDSGHSVHLLISDSYDYFEHQRDTTRNIRISHHHHCPVDHLPCNDSANVASSENTREHRYAILHDKRSVKNTSKRVCNSWWKTEIKAIIK